MSLLVNCERGDEVVTYFGITIVLTKIADTGRGKIGYEGINLETGDLIIFASCEPVQKTGRKFPEIIEMLDSYKKAG